MAEHDTGYKALFSHPEMVADLIRGFVHEEWVRDLDFSSLERFPASFVTPGLGRRESDILWRVRWGRDRWLYVYLLLEFQSTVDPFMALRLMVYVGLLYQHLLKDHQLTDSGKLPPVLPLVLYNGRVPWGAALDVADLVEEVPGGLERYRPRLRYCLLDEGRISTDDLESLRNLAAALFRLERSRGPEEIERVLVALIEWLHAPEMVELRHAFVAWLRQVLLPGRVPGAEIPRMAELEEVKAMLAERVKEWTREWQQEGYEKGLKAGIEKEREEVRAALVRQLEKRFGPLPQKARQRIAAFDLEAILDLSASASTAPSLEALGLSDS
ncbi:MAG: Rpn family recombination-promoting nuclease/putative transposase [Thermoanaerobaculia bacterium]